MSQRIVLERLAEEVDPTGPSETQPTAVGVFLFHRAIQGAIEALVPGGGTIYAMGGLPL